MGVYESSPNGVAANMPTADVGRLRWTLCVTIHNWLWKVIVGSRGT